MKKSFFRIGSLLLAAMMYLTFSASAQTPKPTEYVVYSYMKVAPGKGEEYLKLEKAWKKIHAASKKAGKLDDWGLSRVVSPSGAAVEYNYVARNAFVGADQLAAFLEGSYMPANWESLLTSEEVDLVNRTGEIRILVKNEVWSVVDKVMAEKLSDNLVSVFNYFKVPAGKTQEDHNKIEADIWKPVHAARVKDGAMEGWVLLQMEMPFGSSMPYVLATADIYKDMKSYLAPWFEAYFKKVHPTKKMADLMQQTEAVSDLVKGEVRIRIDHLD
jgi:hypothetical protein